MENIVLEELLKKAKSLGYPVQDYVFIKHENKLIIRGSRRELVAYDNGQWFSPEKAKQNASRSEGGSRGKH